jgi:hypothetical protein
VEADIFPKSVGTWEVYIYACNFKARLSELKNERETGTKAKVVCIGFSKEDNDGERESSSRIPCPALWCPSIKNVEK